MIEKFRSHTKKTIPCLSGVKKSEHQSDDTSLIKLEWCGTQCSGKYGLILKSDDQGQGAERLDSPAVVQSK